MHGWAVNTARTQEPFYQNFSFHQGISFRSVYSVMQDRAGFVWFTGDEGLFRFNGSSFKNYKNPKQNSFSGTYLKEDRYGRIWYQTFDGSHYYFENNVLKHLSTPKQAVLFPFQITDKHLIISEDNRLTVYDLKTLKSIKQFSYRKIGIYAATLFQNELYFLYDNHIWKIDKNLKEKKIQKIEPTSTSFPIICASENAIYLTFKKENANEIWKFQNKKWQKICHLPQDQMANTLQFLRGRLLLSSTKGLLLIHPLTGKIEKRYFSQKNISGVTRDFKNNLWIASPNEGLFLFPNEKLKQNTAVKDLPTKMITVGENLVYTNNQGEITWINTSNFLCEKKSKINLTIEGIYLFYNPLDKLSVACFNNGRTYFEEQNATGTSFYLNIALKQVVPLDHKYYALIGTGYSGFFQLSSKKNLSSTLDPYISKLPQKTIGGITLFRLLDPEFCKRGKSVLYDNWDKTVYFATSNGLFQWQKGETKELFDHGQKIFLKSLFHYNGQNFGLSGMKSISPINGRLLPKNKAVIAHPDVSAIKVYGDTLLIQTRQALHVYKTDENGRVVPLNKLDISNLEIYDFALQNNTIWLSTTKGLLQWDVQINERNNTMGRFHIDNFLVNDLSYPLENQSFDHDQNNVTIHYSILDFGVKTIDKVYYKLNSNNWRELNLGNQNLNLSSLAPDNYTLIFKGFSANKVIFTKKILFTIQNPFWSTWWFFILVSVSVVLAIYLYFRSRIRAVIAKNKLIHEKMSLENDLNKSMITTLKSQMNPHFFYNALNSIQGLVLSGEKEKAGKSIGLFSELSRSVLESTRSNEISLHDEIELLTSYLELECMRLPKIKYQLKVQPDLRQHEIFLPPMLLQPIVENAVKHGLSSKEQEGWLSITFCLEHQNLVVMIDDNGIGRKAAGEKSKLQNRKGSSFSSEANLNRIELMNASYDLNISQEIIDKMDDNQTSTGTIVKVVIPQNEN